ncbi:MULTISPECIES: hypothetical protein [unclassified Prochlorococcus]|uniref:hypothetical protein n=1 Tax=unclassified Prochlorococcus TaxID=2627481 RepID=UPI0005339F9C|nr:MULTISPECIES: hypothetical protein [unclassified Prochlorococcus]KGG15212.1 hypothetical protein EV06_1081 [Prochlorococcus sp. MIT 0602]KGG17487.1 hypothetical protein EV07_0927 [Prochlorococcus sp. MIT 0603]
MHIRSPSIYLAVKSEAKIKIEVIEILLRKIDFIDIHRQFHKINILKYQSLLDIKLKTETDTLVKDIIIFINLPDLSCRELSLLKKNYYLLVCLGDIAEHYQTSYVYSQFLFDGVLLEEPEYRSFFEVYGIPTYDGSLFNHEISSFIYANTSYSSLIPLKQRKYDFSFIGRFDRKGRKSLFEDLNKYFPNLFIHDSTLNPLSNDDLHKIIRNTKFFYNSTSIAPRDTYGKKNFPQYLQLQRKSRLIQYALNGCICFSEILPQRKYVTLDSSFIPIQEIPRGESQGLYCQNYIKNNDSKLTSISMDTYDSVVCGYSSKNIANLFNQIVVDIKNQSPKYSNFTLLKKETTKIELIYTKYKLFSQLKLIIFSSISPFKKLIEVNRRINYYTKGFNKKTLSLLLINLTLTLATRSLIFLFNKSFKP